MGLHLNGQTVFINEVDYLSNSNEGIGVAGDQGTNLTNWSLEVFDKNGNLQSTTPLSGTIPNQSNNYGEIWYPVVTLTSPTVDDINIALIDDNNNVVEFISFGTNTVTAGGGDANGTTSTLASGVAVPQLSTTQTIQRTGATVVTLTWTNTQTASKGTININEFGVLPVELKKFEGKQKNDKILLEWETGSEKNNKEFIIERSQDGKEFTSIGTVEGNGTTTEEQFYEYMDESPAIGWNYYRLKQVDFDGQFEYSEVLSIHHASEGSVSVYPNPITKGQALHIQSDLDELDLTIMSIDGKIVKTQKITGDTTIDCADLPAGMYIYHLTNGKDWTKSERLVIVE